EICVKWSAIPLAVLGPLPSRPRTAAISSHAAAVSSTVVVGSGTVVVVDGGATEVVATAVDATTLGRFVSGFGSSERELYAMAVPANTATIAVTTAMSRACE
ncbi:MAG TPA: hypothetical protein VMS14_00210, partial [Ilumatobacteraceae bacterium]|nr:hypothetical protein [Ilumatobacteraceae bacterium]